MVDQGEPKVAVHHLVLMSLAHSRFRSASLPQVETWLRTLIFPKYANGFVVGWLLLSQQRKEADDVKKENIEASPSLWEPDISDP